MFTAITVFLILASILLVLVILVQNSKGGGLAAGFSSGTQLMGVRKTTDLLEKLTWGLAISIFVLSVVGTFALPKTKPGLAPSSIQEQIDQAVIPSAQSPALPPNAAEGQPGQPAQQQPPPGENPTP
jgi:preprotein translocase subunit SecG